MPAGGLRTSSVTSVRRAPLGRRDGSVGVQPAHQGALGMCDPVADDPDSVVDSYQRSAERATLPTPASETWLKAPACRSESA